MINDMKNDVIELLSCLSLSDCDLKTLVVCANPNYVNGSDQEVSNAVSEALLELTNLGMVKEYIQNIQVFSKNNVGKSRNHKVVLFSFIKNT